VLKRVNHREQERGESAGETNERWNPNFPHQATNRGIRQPRTTPGKQSPRWTRRCGAVRCGESRRGEARYLPLPLASERLRPWPCCGGSWVFLSPASTSSSSLRSCSLRVSSVSVLIFRSNRSISPTCNSSLSLSLFSTPGMKGGKQRGAETRKRKGPASNYV
jgi:hypothetical protein